MIWTVIIISFSMIGERGGNDKEILSDLLDEFKEILENIGEQGIYIRI